MLTGDDYQRLLLCERTLDRKIDNAAATSEVCIRLWQPYLVSAEHDRYYSCDYEVLGLSDPISGAQGAKIACRLLSPRLPQSIVA
jgi:hypothetical protein